MGAAADAGRLDGLGRRSRGSGLLRTAAACARRCWWTCSRHRARLGCFGACRRRHRFDHRRGSPHPRILPAGRLGPVSPICPTCGCSLVRLGINRGEAARTERGGREFLFCCQGCADLFGENPDQFLDEIRDWIVCPTCLAEKPKHLTVSISHEGQQVHFCRCPCCVDEFRRRPAELLECLSA